MYSGYCCSIKLQDPQQLVDFSLKFSYVASTPVNALTHMKKKYPIKILGGLIFGGGVYIYTDIPPVATPCVPWLDYSNATLAGLLDNQLKSASIHA